MKMGRGRMLLLAAPSAGLGVALTAQITVLSWLMTTRYHLDLEGVALVWAAGPLAGIIGQLAVGGLSDRAWWLGGRRRPFLIMGGLVSAAALLTLPHLDAVGGALGLGSIVVVATVVALSLDIAINVGLNPARALIADCTVAGGPRARAFAWAQLASGLAGLAASAVGAWFGNLALISVAAAATLALTAGAALLIAEPRTLPPPPVEAPFSAALAVAMLAPLAPLALLVAGLAAAKLWGAPLPALPLTLAALAWLLLGAVRTLARRGHDPVSAGRRLIVAQALSWIGVFVLFIFLASAAHAALPALGDEALGQTIALGLGLFNLVAAVAPPLLLAPLTKRFRRAYVHAGALVVMAVAFAGIGGAVPAPLALYGWLALAGIGWGAIVCLPYAMFADRVDARRLGMMLGLFNLAIVLPQLAVSLGLGALAPAIGAPRLFFIAAAALLAAALAWAFVPPIPATESES